METSPTERAKAGKRSTRVLMVLENCSYLLDARVGKEARALRDAGYEVAVISPEAGRWPRRMDCDGVAVYGFPTQFPHHFRRYQALGYALEYSYASLAIAALTLYIWLTRGLDVIHVANPPDCLAPLAAIYKLLGKRLIYDQHDLSPELYSARFARSRPWVRRALLGLESLSYRLADHVIVANESCRQIALNRGGVAERAVTVVRNGPELARIPQVSTASVPREEGMPAKSPSDIVIGYAGIIGHQDGLEHLCHAVRSLSRDLGRTDFLCVVVGDGDALPDIKNLARELEIEDRVRFAGWVGDAHTYFRHLADADICVAPEPSNAYNDRSTFVKILEYMASAKPIVAFDLPESRISAGEAALYAAPNDPRDFAAKLAQLMDDERLRKTLGEIGRRRIEESLAWEHSVPQLLGAYAALFNSRRDRAPGQGMQPPTYDQRQDRDAKKSRGASVALATWWPANRST